MAVRERQYFENGLIRKATITNAMEPTRRRLTCVARGGRSCDREPLVNAGR